MGLQPSEANGERDGYIRGGGGVSLGGRRVLLVLAVVALVALAGTTVGLAVSSSRSGARAAALRQRGVPVQVTVTGCLGISSGVGMGIEYWQCRGSYSLAGDTFVETIGGSRKLLETGSVVPAFAVPGDPALLSVSRPAARSGWDTYGAAVVLGAVTLLLAAALSLLVGRSRRRTARA